MDNTLLIVVFVACLSVIIYIILELKTEEEEILEERLHRISKTEVLHQQGKKTGIWDSLSSFYIEPIIEYLKKQKKAQTEEEFAKNDIRNILMQAGKPYSEDDVMRYTAIQAFTAIIFVAIALVLSVLFLRSNIIIALGFVVIFGLVGYKFSVIKLRLEIKRRYREISYNLPDSLDLLVVCVEAGLGLDAALTRVATEQMRNCPELAREFGRVTKDVLAGVPRQEAFRNLARRNDVAELKSFVALLIQTDKLGTSISQSLRVYADTVRTKRRQKAEKLAAEASVKMVIPLVLFILPSMFVVLLGPAILNLVEQFAGGI